MQVVGASCFAKKFYKQARPYHFAVEGLQRQVET